MKCITCGSNKVKKVIKNGNEYFLCEKEHLNPRVKSEGRQVITKQTKHGLTHVSVGAIIKKGNKILLINRRKYPFAHTIPAGHLEHEKPEEAIKREVKEETGLNIKEFKLLKHYKAFYDPCRHGVDYHEWYLYEAEYKGGKLSMDSEGKSIKFYKPNEIKKLKLTIPTKKFLNI